MPEYERTLDTDRLTGASPKTSSYLPLNQDVGPNPVGTNYAALRSAQARGSPYGLLPSPNPVASSRCAPPPPSNMPWPNLDRHASHDLPPALNGSRFGSGEGTLSDLYDEAGTGLPHALNLDLTRQLDAASSLAPPSAPWGAPAPSQQAPYPSSLGLSNPADEYSYDMDERARLLRQPSWTSTPSAQSFVGRNRSHTVYTGDRPILSSAAGVGALRPNATDLLAARLAQMGIAPPQQPDVRRSMARRQTTANAAPQGLDALRQQHEYLTNLLGRSGASVTPGSTTQQYNNLRPSGVVGWANELDLGMTPPAPLEVALAERLAALQGNTDPVALLAEMRLAHQAEEQSLLSNATRPLAHPTPTPTTPATATQAQAQEHQQGQRKTGLYKTELCRKWTERGSCRYGSKCQFAHGKEELRPVERHHLYRTQLCRTFYHTGQCPYGSRCCFIHATTPTLQMSGTPVQAQASLASLSTATQSSPHISGKCTPDVPSPSAVGAQVEADMADGITRTHSGSQRAAPRPTTNRRTSSKSTSGKSAPSGPAAQASANVAVLRLHEALHLARAHPGSASIPIAPSSVSQAMTDSSSEPNKRRPRARSTQSSQGSQGSQGSRPKLQAFPSDSTAEVSSGSTSASTASSTAPASPTDK